MFARALSATIVAIHQPQRQPDQHRYRTKEKSYGPWFWHPYQRFVLLIVCGLYMAGNNGEFSLIYRAVRLICYILFVFYGQFSRTQIDPFKVPFVMATE